MNNTDIEASNLGCKPKVDINWKLPQIWLADWNVVPTMMLIQENVLGEITFTLNLQALHVSDNLQKAKLAKGYKWI